MDGHGASGGDPCGIRCAGDDGLALAVARERHLLDQLPVPVAFFDRDRRLAWLNHAAALVTNRPPEALLGLPAGEIEPGVPIEGGHEFSEAVGRVMRTGEPESWQSTLTLDGAKHTWRVTLSPVRSPEGELLGVSAATLDTTEQFWARRRMAVLSQASARIGSTLDVSHTARELVELATESFAERVTVDLLAEVWNTEGSGTGPGAGAPEPGGGATEPGGGAIEFRRVASGSAPDCPADPGAATCGVHSVARDSLTGRVLEDGEPRGDIAPAPYARDEDRSPPNGTGTATPNGTGEPPTDRAALLVPMVARGTTLGLVTFARRRPHPAFDKADVHLARDLAARTAVCLDNCLRYSRERQAALALQRSLLPDHADEHQAVDIASCYLQSTSATGIGGDWFDVVPLSGARVALAVGDVVGTGIRATATMGRMRTAVRTLAAVELAPDELLTHLDDIVITLDQEEAAHAGGAPVAGATCLYAAYDPVSGRCAIASAGHPEPVLVHPDGHVEQLAVPSGPPLGQGGIKFEATEFDLPAGSRLALYTDGLLHASGKGPEAARAELHALLARPAESLQAVCDRVITHLVPARPAEDVALLLARTHRLGADRLASWELPRDPEVVAPTRERAAGRLREWGLGEDVAFTTELITSELVTNAIRYGADPVVLRLIRDTSSLICEVSDGSSTAPHLRRARTYDEGGRGLLLVASLTQRWGTRYGDSGKTIWAEQPLSQG
ncbi:SpoIIE family protein phosphatase [Streptomyces spiralis]